MLWSFLNTIFSRIPDIDTISHLCVRGLYRTVLHRDRLRQLLCLSVSNCSVVATCLNKTGDWIAVGCSGGGLGQLLVWEWQSETYVMKQQGHTHNTTCLSYSPDGEFIATGGEDGKVKVWTVKTGFCFVTFHEHAGKITGVAWTQGSKAVLSASLDGSVRAFDLKRYSLIMTSHKRDC